MGRVLSREELMERSSAIARRAHSTLANVCFDVLHVGHVRYLHARRRKRIGWSGITTIDRCGPEWTSFHPPGCRSRRARRRSTSVHYVVCSVNGPSKRCSNSSDRTSTARDRLHRRLCAERSIVVEYGGRTAIVGDPKDHATRDLLRRIAETGTERPPTAGG